MDPNKPNQESDASEGIRAAIKSGLSNLGEADPPQDPPASPDPAPSADPVEKPAEATDPAKPADDPLEPAKPVDPPKPAEPATPAPDPLAEPDKPKRPSDEFGELDARTSEATRERFNKLKSTYDEVYAEREEARAYAQQWQDTIAATRASPEQFTTTLRYLETLNR